MALSRGGGGSGNSALSKRDQAQHPIEQSSSQHTPRAARGFCLLDTPESFWKNGYCPYDLSSNNTESKVGVGVGKYVIERIDFGSSFYKNHFYGQGEFWLDIFLYILFYSIQIFHFFFNTELVFAKLPPLILHNLLGNIHVLRKQVFGIFDPPPSPLVINSKHLAWPPISIT